jgi:hypothetical protein
VLGELQDAVVAEQRLRWIGRNRLTDGSAFAAGILVCSEREARSEARAGWRAVWKAARAKRRRRWMR